MIQAKFNLEESQIRFLEQCKVYGFKDRSDLVRTALDQLRRKLEIRHLEKSAELYAEVYGEDAELRELTESALLDWPS